MRRLLLFYLVLAFFSCQKEQWNAPDYGPAPSAAPAAKSGNVSARLAQRTSSTLTIEWSRTAFSNPHKDNSEGWQIGLYRDSACQELVVSWTWDTYGMGWAGSGNFHEPTFHFTGLTPGTAYYFKAQSLDGQLVSDAVRFETEDFPVIVPGKTGLKPGDLILAENFSEFVWGPDPLRWSVGYVPENIEGMKTIQQATGANPDGFIPIAEIPYSFSLARFQKSTRMKDWLLIGIPDQETPVKFLSSCVDISESSYRMFARLATPRLTGLGSAFATVRVSFQTAGNLSSHIPSPDEAMIYVIDEGKTFDQTLYNYPFAMAHAASSAVSRGPDGWANHEVILNNIRQHNRIGFRINKGYSTSLLRNVKVELVSYGMVDEKPQPPTFDLSYSDTILTAEITSQPGVSYYKASFRTVGSQSWQDAPDAYPEALSLSFALLKPLYRGRNYEIRISAVSYSGVESEPTIMTVNY